MEINILKSNINTNIIRIATCMRESPLSTQTCHDSKLPISPISPIPSIGCRKATAPLRAATPSLRRICAVGRRRRGVDEGRRSPSTFWEAARAWSGARIRTGRASS